MKEIKVTLTREELQDLWSACVIAEEEEEKKSLLATAMDLKKLRNKLFSIIMNN